MSRTIFKNARVLDPSSGLDEKGAVLIEDDRILEAGPNVFVDSVQDDVNVVDCAGKCLAPGLIDMRVETGEPGHDHRETFATASLAAAAGGVTTIVCLPNTDPVVDDPSVLEFVQRRAAAVGMVNIHSYGAATKGLRGEEMAELGLLHMAGAVGFTDAHRAIDNSTLMRRILAYSTMFDSVVIQHPEDPDLVGSGVMNTGETATRLGMTGIPPVAEVIMVERDLRLVETTGARYHASRLSTAAAIRVMRRAKDKGLNVTCDTAPHYFALNEGAVTDYRTFAKVSPPLKSEDDRLAVVAGLADGTIDAIVSDHTPRDPDSKRLTFELAETGTLGLETLLPVTLELVNNRALSMLAALAPLTCNPARILGLPGGTLAKGAPADLVIFDPEVAGIVDADKLLSKSKNSIFDGRPIQGRVLKTVRGGRVIYDVNAEISPGLNARARHA
jgi:dihydroorotase